jgi:hypothetical protein
LNATIVQYLNAKRPSCQEKFNLLNIIKYNYTGFLVMNVNLLENKRILFADLLGSNRFLLLPEHSLDRMISGFLGKALIGGGNHERDQPLAVGSGGVVA